MSSHLLSLFWQKLHYLSVILRLHRRGYGNTFTTNSEEIQEVQVLPPVLEGIMKSRSLETVINSKFEGKTVSFFLIINHKKINNIQKNLLSAVASCRVKFCYVGRNLICHLIIIPYLKYLYCNFIIELNFNFF